MKYIKALVGISNSGKSTYCHEQWTLNPHGTLIVNRDKIRELLFAFSENSIKDYYLRPDISKCEKQVTKYEDLLIHEGLAENKTVIIDSTNLSAEYISRYKYFNVPIELVWFDVTLKEALTRNMGRNRKVSEEIIKKQYNKYIQLRKDFEFEFTPTVLENNSTKPGVWVFDIDNTIAKNNSGRSPFDWKRVGEDDVDYAVEVLFQTITSDEYDEIIFCSGRDEVCREETMNWLKKNLGAYNQYQLLMRKEGDIRPDWIVKEELWREITKENHIIALIDDRNQVCMRARALGLKVFQVEYGNF